MTNSINHKILKSQLATKNDKSSDNAKLAKDFESYVNETQDHIPDKLMDSTQKANRLRKLIYAERKEKEEVIMNID